MITRHQKPLVLASIIIIFAIFLAACAPAMQSPSYDKSTGGVAPAPAAPRQEVASESGFGYSSGTSPQSIERLVIQNATLRIAVADPVSSKAAIARLAEEMGGYVVSASQDTIELNSGISVPRASITIRVPSTRLNEALEIIRAESKQDPINENINSQDVTSEYVDLQSRLRNLEKAEVQLSTIMEEANKTEDVLSVYNQLVSVQEQIEVIKGQIKYYEESAALSSISVELVAEESIQPLSVAGWQPVGVARDAVQALIDTVRFLVNVVIWLVIYILPVLLLLYLIFILPFTLVWRAWRKRRAARKAPPAETPREV